MKLRSMVGGVLLGIMCFATGCGPGLGHHGRWATNVSATTLTSAPVRSVTLDESDPWTTAALLPLDTGDPWAPEQPATPVLVTWGGAHSLPH
jgi:hypothetical protein